MSNYVPVEGFTGLVRDMSNNALINVNAPEIEQARQRKELLRRKRLEEKSIRDDVEGLKDDVNEIKEMLKILLDRKDINKQ